MALERNASAVWTGDLRGGNGRFTMSSGTLTDTPYSFATRFENAPGTNPEELIAAAHASCYSMALAAALGGRGFQPQEVCTDATCVVEPQSGGGFKITRMRLNTHASVPGLANDQFQEIAKAAEAACPVSNALRGGVNIELTAALA
ncbi:MAG: OsmC family protein [Candidatus Eremiobacteraeota bacterium]|nr:OsmC family protein [Candidatus Eremiobacteraeota bacterium]MBV9736885.1 OsmC family protein [Candidatus Eremiobacteraeota bacterium]